MPKRWSIQVAVTLEEYENPADELAGGKIVAPSRELPVQMQSLDLAMPTQPSIVLLPFKALGNNQDESQALATGLRIDIQKALTKMTGVFLIGAGSANAMRDWPAAEAGTRAGVRYVLEGSVQKAGEHIRIVAQLLDTTTGGPLWSQRYDRTLEDVFAIQDEIANTIVSTLRATTFASLETPVAKRHTENVRAHSLYLRGRHAWNKRTQEGVFEAIDFFQQAIAEDAWAPRIAIGGALYGSHRLQVRRQHRPNFRDRFDWRMKGSAHARWNPFTAPASTGA
jgi:TolB-like protein